jgi:urease gamma subunit
MLVDTLLSNPGRQWTNLLQSNVFMKMVLPLLQARKDLEKALERSSANQLGKKSAASDSEKRALLERLTSLLKNKLCKIRWSKGSQNQSDDAVDLLDELMNQARKSISTENLSCCSAALLATLKNMTDIDDMINASHVYGEALTEWSTKRTTKLQTSLFDDFVQQHQRYVYRNHKLLATLFDLVFTPLSNKRGQSCPGYTCRPVVDGDKGSSVSVLEIGVIQAARSVVSSF